MKTTTLLLLEVANGSAAAWVGLANRVRDDLIRVLIHRGFADIAEDAVNEVLLQLPKKAQKFDGGLGTSARGWLRVVVRHEALSAMRKAALPGRRGVGGTDNVDSLESLADGVADEFDACVLRQLVNEILDELRRDRPVRTQWYVDAYRQTVLEGREAAGVAGDLGQSILAVTQAKSRIGKELRRRLEAAGYVIEGQPA